MSFFDDGDDWSAEALAAVAQRIGGDAERRFPGRLGIAALERYRAATLDERLPWNPFADAREGDWRLDGIAAPEGHRDDWTIAWDGVVAVEGDRVLVRDRVQSGVLALPSGPARVFSRATPPRLADVLGLAPSTVANVRVAEGKLRLEGGWQRGLVVRFDVAAGGRVEERVRCFSRDVRVTGAFGEHTLGWGRRGAIDGSVRALASVFERWARATAAELHALSLGLG